MSENDDGSAESLLNDSESDVESETNSFITTGVLEPVSLKETAKREIEYIKEAVVEASNPLTFLTGFVVVFAMYVNLIGWGPYLGPIVGPWLHSHGLPGGGEWLPGVYGGHRTKYTLEGEKRDHDYMREFAERVRILPETHQLESLKVDLKHLRSSIGSIIDEIHEDMVDGQYKKDTYMQSKFEETWNGAAEFYSPNPRIVESNLTLGMFVNAHVLHGHSHMRLPRDWYDCMHIGISSWDLIEISNQMRSRPSFDMTGRSQLDNAMLELADLQEAYRETDEILQKEINGLYPSPSEVLPWFGLHNRTGFLLQGSVLKYCPRDLQQQNALSGGKGRSKFDRAVESVAKVARKLQISPGVLMLWYGHQWGDELGESDPLKHMNVLQEIYPVVSGLQVMRFSGVVHRTNAPIPPMNPITRIPTKMTNLDAK